MVKINYTALEFDHLVIFEKDHTVFAAARENGNGHNGNGHLRLFLITNTGNVYTRNGRADSWDEVRGNDRDSILARVIAGKNSGIPVYRINGNGRDNTDTGGSI